MYLLFALQNAYFNQFIYEYVFKFYLNLIIILVSFPANQFWLSIQSIRSRITTLILLGNQGCCVVNILAFVTVASIKTESSAFNQFLEKLDCHHMTVSRVAQVHRAVAASCDPKGQNFVVIQVRRLFLLVNLNLL